MFTPVGGYTAPPAPSSVLTQLGGLLQSGADAFVTAYQGFTQGGRGGASLQPTAAPAARVGGVSTNTVLLLFGVGLVGVGVAWKVFGK